MRKVKRICYERSSKRFCYDALFISQEVFKILSPFRVKLLSVIRDNPYITASEIAKKIGVDVFKIYYHLNVLNKYGLIDIEEKKIGNLIEKKYSLGVDALFYPMVKPSVEKYISKQIVIVVGSPDPHGQFNLRARDGFLAGEIAGFLGNKGYDVHVVLDVDHEHADDIIYVVIGGPLTNSLSYKLNAKLKIKYSEDKHYRSIHSTLSRAEYSDENISLIAKKDNYVIVSGINISSTTVGIFALKDVFDDILKHKEAYLLLEGIDEDSDGIMEKYNVLERHYL